MKYLKFLWQYLYNLAVALDQLGNTLLAGDPDETISKRAGRARAARPGNVIIIATCWFIDGLFILIGETRHIERVMSGETKAKELWDWTKK